MTAAVRVRRTSSLLVFAAALGFSGIGAAQPPTPAEPPAPAAPAQPKWYSGKPYGWVSGGTTFAYGQTYGSVNVGAGWLMRNGLAPNVELGSAFGATPTIWSVRPGVSWFLPIPRVQPFIGAYYTHWFVGGDGYSDQNGVGGRAGVSIGSVLAVGVNYDHVLSCPKDCDSWTPVISAGYAF